MAKREDNLKPFDSNQSREKAKINGKKGGVKSGEAKREKKLFKEIFETLVQLDVERFTTDEEVLEALNLINPEYAEKADVKYVVAARVIHKALKGDMYAIGFLRDSLGESPTIKQEVVNTNLNIESNIDKAKELKKLLDKNG